MAIDKFYDKFLELLNDNDNDLLYKGNFIFKFHTDSMTVYTKFSETEDYLVRKEVEYSPVSLISKTPVPFVENNKRVDWLLEFGLLTRIEGQEYDADTDLDYANIVSVLSDLNGAVTDIDTYRFASKTQEPTYNGYTVLGKYKYAILTVTMNVTEVINSKFGQDSTWELDSSELDVVEVNSNATRRFYTADKKSELSNDFNDPIGRSFFVEITFNYNDETAMLLEAQGKQTLSKTYTLTETIGETTQTYTMVCESATRTDRKNSVMQITARFVEV